ncbi:Protein CBG02155 [Caenorhabditis briggsae]|uniref:Protein CBG02155 n=1 Tax=Caenorhabditis briggsae TaxID=6238 RepID=A8WS28_CAEBR|nr:Protein CBG02155 [Caenorhabditis briggsae]CAP23286.1 Protein CBG02155 [Caenorhabditis briggsae]
MNRIRRGLKAGDVVWAGAYPGLLVRKKNSNRWVIEFFGFSHQVGSEKTQNIVAFHIGDYVPCPQGETVGYYETAIQEAIDYMDAVGTEWGSEGRRSVSPNFFQKFGLVRHVDAEMDQTLNEELDETIEEEYEVGMVEPKEKSARNQIIVSVAMFVLVVVWYITTASEYQKPSVFIDGSLSRFSQQCGFLSRTLKPHVDNPRADPCFVVRNDDNRQGEEQKFHLQMNDILIALARLDSIRTLDLFEEMQLVGQNSNCVLLGVLSTERVCLEVKKIAISMMPSPSTLSRR